jgi:hypothetical protein
MMPAGQPAPPRRHRGLVIIAVIVVVLILVVAVLALEFAVPAGVTVDYINIWAPDNVCGYLTNANANPVSYYGFNSSTGETQTFVFPLPNFNTTACTIDSMVTNSSGFAISGFTLPIQIAGNNGTANVNITIASPTSPFSGNMNIVIA